MSDAEKDEKAFNKAADAYEAKFDEVLPLGIGFPKLTTELLLKAVASGQSIEEDIPPGTVS